MILTDYYKFTKLPNQVAKGRMDCIASTKSYPQLEEKRFTKIQRKTEKRDSINIGDLIVYVGNVPERFGRKNKRKADKSITLKSENLSSIYFPDIEKELAFGDFRGTSDALLFVFTDFFEVNGRINEGSTLEIFVARGKAKNVHSLYQMLSDGDLDEELETLRKTADL